VASDVDFVEFVVDQIDPSLDVRHRKMFGEYGIWSNDKIVILICDNQVFVKPTEAGRAFIGDVVEAPPYPGAKNSFLIGDQVEDSEWLSELIRISEAELPKPKPRKKKKKKRQ
jgi:TfoX/Sxy family transcriptional regulator of competence genes